MPPRNDTPETIAAREALGALMAGRRKELGLTRGQVCEAMGVAPTAQSELALQEAGKVDPGYTKLLKWATALGMTVRIVVTERRRPKPPADGDGAG